MLLGEVGENLAVEGDLRFLEGINKLGVRSPKFFEGSAHAYVPEAAKVSFLVSSMGERVSTGMKDSFVCLALLSSAAMSIAFNFAEDISSGFKGINAFFDSGHD